jgi:GDP-L-fucose synthase
MKRVLLTGGTGFVGRNTSSHLSTVCELYAPKRAELNLLDEVAVREYITKNNIEIVLNLANPNPVKNALDKQDRMFEDSIRSFLNLFRAQDCYEMMYTLGSGAEYDKSKDIISISEEQETRSLPYDSYGLSKYTINQIISGSERQCNLRIFGCYGPTDHESKFITHAIRCCLRGEDITIRQDCYFDYMHVYDLGKIMGFFIDHRPMYRSYNVCTGTRVLLSEIAAKVKSLMGSDSEIIILSEGMNKEYTGSNRRLLDEMGGYDFMTLEEGIKIQIEAERKAADRQ